MAEAAHPAQHEFWRPPMSAATGVAGHTNLVEACDRCATEFIVDSRFCHACGAARVDLNAPVVSRLREKVTFVQLLGLGEQLGLSTAAFIAFGIGVLCLVCALGVSLIFSARTMVDWQAVQLWRIEWLLGAVAAFIAGCLLKKS